MDERFFKHGERAHEYIFTCGVSEILLLLNLLLSSKELCLKSLTQWFGSIRGCASSFAAFRESRQLNADFSSIPTLTLLSSSGSGFSSLPLHTSAPCSSSPLDHPRGPEISVAKTAISAQTVKSSPPGVLCWKIIVSETSQEKNQNPSFPFQSVKWYPI